MPTPAKPTDERIRRAKRKPGRPAARENGSTSKADVIRCALELCRNEPLQNVSIVRVASEMNVTPALIHYYVGGRDRLTSGVMNLFYESLVVDLPPPVADWRADMTGVFNTLYQGYIRYGGVVAYVMSHNRFRLYQLVENDETDYGARFFERVVASVRGAGLSAQRTAMYTHLLLQHLLSSAYQQASRQLPENHQEYLVARGRKLDAKSSPNTQFVLESFATLRGDDAFGAGLAIIADAISRESSEMTGSRATARLRTARGVRSR
jgi:AcrR family transcriptional regulator